MDKLIYILFLLIIMYFLKRDFYRNNLENFENDSLGNLQNDKISIDNLAEITKILNTPSNNPINNRFQRDLNVLNNFSVSNGNFVSEGSSTITINDISGTTGIFNTLNLLPKGLIMAWNGSTAPSGWAICDGTNGTPDLSKLFILCASNNIPSGESSSVNSENLNNASLTKKGAIYLNDYVIEAWNRRVYESHKFFIRLDKENMPKHKHYIGKINNNLIGNAIPNYSSKIDSGDIYKRMRTGPNRGYYTGNGEPYGYMQIDTLDGKREAPDYDFHHEQDNMFAWSHGGDILRNLKIVFSPPYYSLMYIMKL